MRHQLLALAMGGQCYKLPFGHRGFNQPVRELHPSTHTNMYLGLLSV